MKSRLEEFLSTAAIAIKEDETFDRACLYDRVTLVSRVDSRDWLKLTVVLPGEEDDGPCRLPVTDDISRAVLGRRCGERVSWQAPPGIRRMSIAAVAKFDLLVG